MIAMIAMRARISVLRETLAFLVAAKRGEELLNERHVAMPPG
jgi:hypothetical protein